MDISRIHAQITLQKNYIAIVDSLGETGILVNGMSVAKGRSQELDDGDVITIPSTLKRDFRIGYSVECIARQASASNVLNGILRTLSYGVAVDDNEVVEASLIKKKMLPSYLKGTASSQAKRTASLAGSPRGSPIAVRHVRTSIKKSKSVDMFEGLVATKSTKPPPTESLARKMISTTPHPLI
jgi:hypothetical protein